MSGEIPQPFPGLAINDVLVRGADIVSEWNPGAKGFLPQEVTKEEFERIVESAGHILTTVVFNAHIEVVPGIEMVEVTNWERLGDPIGSIQIINHPQAGICVLDVQQSALYKGLSRHED